MEKLTGEGKIVQSFAEEGFREAGVTFRDGWIDEKGLVTILGRGAPMRDAKLRLGLVVLRGKRRADAIPRKRYTRARCFITMIRWRRIYK
jgi:hypothetical protein